MVEPSRRVLAAILAGFVAAALLLVALWPEAPASAAPRDAIPSIHENRRGCMVWKMGPLDRPPVVVRATLDAIVPPLDGSQRLDIVVTRKNSRGLVPRWVTKSWGGDRSLAWLTELGLDMGADHLVWCDGRKVTYKSIDY